MPHPADQDGGKLCWAPASEGIDSQAARAAWEALLVVLGHARTDCGQPASSNSELCGGRESVELTARQ